MAAGVAPAAGAALCEIHRTDGRGTARGVSIRWRKRPLGRWFPGEPTRFTSSRSSFPVIGSNKSPFARVIVAATMPGGSLGSLSWSWLMGLGLFTPRIACPA